MRSIWGFSIFLNLISFISAVPIDAVYGESCNCPYKFDYKVSVPQLPKPKKYTPNNYGFDIDASPIQAKAKVSYTFDFSVEEPKSQRPIKPEKYNTIFAKVDRIGSHKVSCPYAYAQQSPRTNCGCAIAKPYYRYLNEKLSQPCRCRNPKCNCNAAYPNNVNIESPVLVASGSLRDIQNSNSIRRKRDLEEIFFRPFRSEQLRPARYVKLYHKPINSQKEKESENWFNMDLFSDASPFKRKTKKSWFPDFRSRLVKRDIKGEYDLLERERQETDLTVPEIIQYMPETLNENFKRGACRFGCRENDQKKSSFDIPSKNNIQENQDRPNETNHREINKIEAPVTDPISTMTKTAIADDEKIKTFKTMENSHAKRNVNGCQWQADELPLSCPYSTWNQNDHSAQYPSQNPKNPQQAPAISLCQQRNLYASMKRAEEQQYASDLRLNNGHIGEKLSQSRSMPDPIYPGAQSLYYAGDLEIPPIQHADYSRQEPTLGSPPNYPVQHVSGEVLDKIISDIVYRHPEFIEASDPEPEQEEQTKGFIKKLINGRLGLLFNEHDHTYLNHYSIPSFISEVPGPYFVPPPLSYLPSVY